MIRFTLSQQLKLFVGVVIDKMGSKEEVLFLNCLGFMGIVAPNYAYDKPP